MLIYQIDIWGKSLWAWLAEPLDAQRAVVYKGLYLDEGARVSDPSK